MSAARKISWHNLCTWYDTNGLHRMQIYISLLLFGELVSCPVNSIKGQYINVNAIKARLHDKEKHSINLEVKYFPEMRSYK